MRGHVHAVGQQGHRAKGDARADLDNHHHRCDDNDNQGSRFTAPLGVIFFLYRLKDVGIYVTLFAVGHVITLLAGVLMEISVSAYLIDAIIGFSVAYKALDNMGAFQRWFGFQPNTKVATFGFGLIHGFGLATKLLDYQLQPDGLLVNLLSFNVGVEIGQVLALAAILIAMTYWRKSGNFMRHAYTANTVMMMLGFLLMGYQLVGYFTV